MIRRLILGVAFAGLLSGAEAVAQAIDLDAAALEKLKAGETVTRFTADKSQSAAGLLQAVIDVPAPRERLWRILTDCSISVKVLSGVKSCKIIKAEPGGNADVREFIISWSSLLPNVRSVFRSQYDAPNAITFNRTEGDLKEFKGEWRLEALPDGTTTRLHYAAHVVVGIPVPNAIVRAALENDTPKTMRSIRAAATAK